MMAAPQPIRILNVRRIIEAIVLGVRDNDFDLTLNFVARRTA
jgi:hypothetical protein